MSFFLFGGHCYCCHVKYMSYTQVKARMSKKKFRKNFSLGYFLINCASTSLPFSVPVFIDLEFEI
jgi:hypothetical protein